MGGEERLRGPWRWLAPISCFVTGGVIGAAAYFSLIPFDLRMWMRGGLCAIFIVVLPVVRRNRPVSETVLGFLAVSAGLLISGLLFRDVAGLLRISDLDARGYAVDKIGETLPIIAFILLLTLLSGRDLASLSLRRGKLGLSLLFGLAIGLLLFAYFLAAGGWQVFQGGNLTSLLPTIGWVTLFSAFNAFMEELWFRGLFQSRFEWLLGRGWAFWLTALLFGLLHLLGSFSGTLGTLLLSGFTVLLGIGFCYIVRRTGSIWGAVVGHFFADFFLMLGYFATAG